MNYYENDQLGHLIREETILYHIFSTTKDADEANFAYDGVTRLNHAIEEKCTD